MFSLIPLPYKLLAIAALLAGLFGAGWWKGSTHTEAKWQAKVAAQLLATSKFQTKQAEATVKTITQYVDRVRTVRVVGDTITKEVPVYVTVQADAACVIPRGFVRVHDAAAANVPVDKPAGTADAAPAGVALSAVAETVADNYRACAENAEQLIALQGWVMDLSGLAAR